MRIKGILVGIVIGLLISSFAPRASDLTRMGFDSGRNLIGATVATVGLMVRPAANRAS